MKAVWQVTRLAEVCKTAAGGTPLKSNKEFYEGGKIPWLQSGEVSQGEISAAKTFITELGLKKSSAKLFPANTVLVAMYGATAGQVGTGDLSGSRPAGRGSAGCRARYGMDDSATDGWVVRDLERQHQPAPEEYLCRWRIGRGGNYRGFLGSSPRRQAAGQPRGETLQPRRHYLGGLSGQLQARRVVPPMGYTLANASKPMLWSWKLHYSW